MRQCRAARTGAARAGEETWGLGVSGDNGQVVGQWVDVSTPPGAPTEVDVDTLAEAIPWLDSLKKYVETTLTNQVVAMLLTGNQAGVIFGGFEGAGSVSSKHKTYVQNAAHSYRNIAQQLDVAVRATQDIVKNYKDAEHNNSLTIQKIDTTFTDEQSGRSDSSTTSSGSATPATATAADTGPSSSSDTSGEIAQ
jgi:hypothetical protein